jgi:hypothetical protein
VFNGSYVPIGHFIVLDVCTLYVYECLFFGIVKVRLNITILDIIRRHVFYLKHNVSETGFCLRQHVVRTQLGPIGSACPCPRRPRLSLPIGPN